ncbi:MAG TPA: GNAT family N-acetyltransferase [Candidatus Saccharimonadales bacterium]|nr:GNAT family N-acetyltransferase [Candidatus Saccharimonadales bacterium]
MQSNEAIHGVTLDFQNPNELTEAAVRLILTEIHDEEQSAPVVKAEDVTAYINATDTAQDVHYGLVNTDGALVAAARVDHTKSDGTMIDAFAVAPQHRGQHLGRRLMHLIAIEAAKHHQTNLEAGALAPGFFARLGFTPIHANTIMMRADTADVIRRTEPTNP